MRGKKGHMKQLLLGAVCFICLAQALFYGTIKADETTCVIQTENRIDGNQALSLSRDSRDGDLSFTLWGESENVQVAAPDLNRKANAGLITAAGSSGLILPGSRTLEVTDTGGCMIDEKLSGLLFGSTKIQGKSLMIDGRPYEILGVLPGSSGTALIQADRDTKAVMNRVTLHITGKESRQEAVRRFSGSTGIQGTLLPLHLYGIFSEALLRITAAFFLLYLLSGIFRKADGLFPLLVGILSAAACIWILDIRIRIPGDMLPSQWSDFAFWAEAAEQKAGEIALLFKAEKSGMELSYFTSAFISGLFSIFSVLPGYFFLRSLRLRKLSSLLMMTGFFLLLSFSFCILHGQNSSALIQERILWLFFPFCLWLTYLKTNIGIQSPPHWKKPPLS